VNRGRVIDRQDVRPNVDRQHQLGTAKNDRLDLALAEFRDECLKLALAVADDPAGGELLKDDPVDLRDPFRLDGREGDPASGDPVAKWPSLIVKRVPSKATLPRPSAVSLSAMASPMWSIGTPTFLATAS